MTLANYRCRSNIVAGLLCLAFTTACVTASPSGSGRVVVSVADSQLIYQPPKADNLELTYYSEVTNRNYKSATVVARTKSLFPHARFTLSELQGNFYFTKPLDLEAYVKSLNFAKDESFPETNRGAVKAYYGYAHYLTFGDGQKQCVALVNTRDNPMMPGVNGGVRRTYGHYCGQPGTALAESDIVTIANSLGVRKDGLPDHLIAASKAQQSARIELPFQIHWTGYNDDLSVTLVTDSASNTGRHWFALPAGGGDCTGQWKSAGGRYDGSTNYPRGDWTLLCTNGRSAAGSYVSMEKGSGFGEGVDAEGRKMILVFGAHEPTRDRLAKLPRGFVCRAALPARKGMDAWSTNPHAGRYVEEARRRSLSPGTCEEHRGESA